VMEQMIREVRTGSDFCSDAGDCVIDSELSFKNVAGEKIIYRLDLVNSVVERSVGSGAFAPLTASNVSIRYLAFTLSGNRNDDGRAPRITIVMGVSSKELGVAGTVVNVQTTVSGRILDG
jgi:hypothetical protein